MSSNGVPAITISGTGTFTRPPLDNTLTVDQLYEWHRVNSRDAVAFVFSKQDGHLESLNWKQLGDGVIQGVEIIKHHIPKTPLESDLSLQQKPIVVGFLATADTITYTTFLFSHIRLTHPDSGRPLLPFPISPRNSAAAVAHLVNVTGVEYLWVTNGPMRSLVDEALRQGGLENTMILPFPSFSELYLNSPASVSSTSSKGVAEVPVPLDQPAVILHSSGSTAFPKPRTLTHRILQQASRLMENASFKVEGETMGLHTCPVFHVMGLSAELWPAVSGYIRATAAPGVPQPPVTPDSFLKQIVESKSTIIFCVPSFLEAWSMNSESLKEIKKLKCIMWGGGPLQKDIGQLLYKEGVRMSNSYGTTEVGGVSLVIDTPYTEGYDWFELMPHIEAEFIPEEDGLYELVLKDSEKHRLAVCNTKIGNIPAYATSDLVELHKSNPKLIKIIGRKDDQIMLSTGEKTNPGPLEPIIVKNPHVMNAIMFGRERLSNGVLIEPVSYDEAKKMGAEKFRNLIWPSIESANAIAPAHSRIFKEMILLASPSKPLAYTGKQTPRRGVILKDYAPEIDALYKAVEESSSTNVPIPVGSSAEGGWTLDESLGFIRDVIHSILKGSDTMGDEDDVFGFGCDSLQATHIRNTMLHALRQVAPPANVHMVPSNVVYQHPTVRDLATFASRVSRSANVSVDINTDEARRQSVLKLVTKYTQDWPTHKPANDATNPTDEIILLTGSTGALGSQLLAQLLTMPSVSRIYAFNRPAQQSSRDRHLEAFRSRGNDVALLESEKVVYVEGDTAVNGFNIRPQLFAEIRNSVTTIIHNAWRVDFNVQISSFEPAIQGVRHMIDLALQSPHASPPRVMFTSTSAVVVKAWSDMTTVAEAPLTDLTRINASGYSESKWVSERILSIAGQETPLRPIIVRVGQLCGGINGNWNHREWFPALVRASQVVGGAPSSRGLVAYVPLHVAASAMIELRNTSKEFLHIAHPRPIPWKTVIGFVSDILQVPNIPYNEWLARLEASPKTDEDLYRNPALQLLDFYRALVAQKDVPEMDDGGAMGSAMYDTTITVGEAPSLNPSQLAQLGRGDVERWIGFWRSTGGLEV